MKNHLHMTYGERSRRRFIYQFLQAGGVALSGGLVFSACGGKETSEKEKEATPGDCGDLSGVSESEIQKRQKLGYVEKSPIDESHCDNCSLYIPAESDKACGKCMLFDGPVYAEGYCTYWAPLV